MKTLNKTRFILLLLTLLLVAMVSVPAMSMADQQTVNLETASNFAVLAGTGITNEGQTTITGDVGTFPTKAETGFGSVALIGTNHNSDATTQVAKTDLTTAYNDAAGRTPTAPKLGDAEDLGGKTFYPGVYNSASSLQITAGDLTLDAQGKPNAVFIFQMGSALITASNSEVILAGGAQPSNIFWQVGSSATLGTNSTFNGTILAYTSITAKTGAMAGRLLAMNGAVTLDNNTLTNGSNATTGSAGAGAESFPLLSAPLSYFEMVNGCH